MSVAKAVVVAANRQAPAPWPDLGLPTRHLAPVANKPILVHHLEALSLAGIGEAAIVCDRRSNAVIRDVVGDGAAWNLDVHYVEASPVESILASSAIAEFVGSAPVLVQDGDILLHEDMAALQGQFADHGLDALVMRAGRGSATQLLHARAPNCYLIGTGVFPDLRRHASRLRDAVRQLGANGARIEVRDVEASLPCVGGTDGLLAANRRLLEALGDQVSGERLFDSEVHGRLALDPSAEVHASVIRGPVAIGPGACITNSYIGPYTSIGPGVVIDCAEIEHSIVLGHAQIRYLDTRIESSVVGPGASVSRDFRVPRAVRLSLGEGAQVSLA
jgi:glucose-1-phosphate thymidylyltransferase